MSGDPLATPPDTPDPGNGKGPAPANVNQKGKVNYEGAVNKGGITTGHIFGEEVVLSTIKIAVASATDLTKNIQEFTARVDLQLDRVSDKVGNTASVLASIKKLVVRQAKKKEVEANQDTKDAEDAKGQGNAKGGKIHPEDQDDVSSKRAFKNIMEASRGVKDLFDNISDRIKDAREAIDLVNKLHQGDVNLQTVTRDGPQTQTAVPPPPEYPSQDEKKIELSDNDRERVLLTEVTIDSWEKDVDSRRADLFMRFIVYEYYLDHERRDEDKQELKRIRLILINQYRLMKQLAAYLTGNPTPDQHQSPIPLPNPLDHNTRAGFPHPARLASLYVGWVFHKSLPPPPHNHPSQPQKPSWQFAFPTRIPFSTEELFLRVLAQVAQRAKVDQSLKDEYLAVLKKRSQRLLVDRLLAAQNGHLQRDFPQLEWTIAGLEPKVGSWALIRGPSGGKKGRRKKAAEIAAFEVILKTQWRLTPGLGPPPKALGGIGGPVPTGPPGLRLNPGPFPVGGFPRIPSGPQGSAGPSNQSFGRDGQDASGGQGAGIPIIIDTDAGAGTYPTPRVTLASRAREVETRKHKPAMTIREPKLVLVKEGGKKKNKTKERKKAKSKKSDKQFFVEVHRPGSYIGGGPSTGRRFNEQEPPVGPNIRSQPPPTPHIHPHYPLRPPPSFTPSDRSHIPQYNPPPPPPRPPPTYLSSYQTPREQEEEEEEVVKDLFEEFSELTDRKGKRKSNQRDRRRWDHMPERMMGDRSQATFETSRQQEEEDSDVGRSRMLMRRVERESSRRMTVERKEMQAKMERLERMAETQRIPIPRRQRQQEHYREAVARERNSGDRQPPPQPPPPGPSRIFVQRQEGDYIDEVRERYRHETPRREYVDERVQLTQEHGRPHREHIIHVQQDVPSMRRSERPVIHMQQDVPRAPGREYRTRRVEVQLGDEQDEEEEEEGGS